VSSLRWLGVVATGWVYVDGAHIVRRDLRRLIESGGGRFQEEFQGSTDVVIQGYYLNHQIQEDRYGGVDALDQLWRARSKPGGRHIHLVRTDDLVDLLAGGQVLCRRLPRDWEKFRKMPRKSIRRGQLGS